MAVNMAFLFYNDSRIKKNRLGKNMVIEHKCINPSWHLETISTELGSEVLKPLLH